MPEATEYPHLSKAPIVEAMIGIQTEAISESVLKNIEELNSALREEYPTVEPQSQQIETESTPVERLCAFRLVHREKKYAFLVGLEGLFFSRFAPYDTWEDLTENAERIWNHYLTCFQPLSIKEFVIRYINDFALPENAEISDYFRAFVTLPDDFLSTTLTNMFVRLELPLEKEGGLLTLHQILQPRSSDQVSVILDYQLEYSALGLKPDQLWSVIKAKRNEKNKVFFSCITKEMEDKLK